MLDLVTALANCEAVGNHHMRSQGQLCLHGQHCACSALCYSRINCTEADLQQRVPRRPGSVVCFPAQAAVIREPPRYRDPLQSHSPSRRQPSPTLYGGADAPRTASKCQADDERGRAQVSLRLLALALNAAADFQSMALVHLPLCVGSYHHVSCLTYRLSLAQEFACVFVPVVACSAVCCLPSTGPSAPFALCVSC